MLWKLIHQISIYANEIVYKHKKLLSNFIDITYTRIEREGNIKLLGIIIDDKV